MSSSSFRRVVVTGMGVVSPLGCGVELTWRRLLQGRSGVRTLPPEVAGELPARVAGQVPGVAEDEEGGFDLDSHVSAREQRKMDHFIGFALGAAQEALQQARWAPVTPRAQESTATIVASGVGGFPAIAKAVRTSAERGPGRLSPFTIPSFLVNLAAGHISIRHQLRGPLGAPATACAASIQAIGDGARLIRCGEVDVAVCGGAEAVIDSVTLGSFAAARALSTQHNNAPASASRPFDIRRDGFVVGEGAAILVLESLDHALERGATPLAEILGYGASADAHHITASPEDGNGMRRAMEGALAQAQLTPAQIQYVCAHATSTPLGDEAELAALHSLFRQQSPVAVSSIKGATGHLLGAAGALASVFTIQAMACGQAPMTLNLDEPCEHGHGLHLVRGTPYAAPIQHALVNGFGFGGVNASLLVGKMP